MSLLLGPVTLDGFEVAGGVRYGGAQRIDVHELSGGGRVVDALGRADGQVEFAGYLTGADATLRARALDALRVSGAAVPLIWDAYVYTVVIRELTLRYASPFWIGFECDCTVVRDEAQAILDAAFAAAPAAFSLAAQAVASLADPFAGGGSAQAFGAAAATAGGWASATAAGFA